MRESLIRNGMERRAFLRGAAAAGAGLMWAPMMAAGAEDKKDELRVAILGAGEQGQALLDACIKMSDPGVRFVAVCDIWESYNLTRVSRLLKAYKHEVNSYIDYQDMLGKEKDLDAVIIATPDFWHSEHTVACLKAGINVYCEKEMSNTIEGAKAMVKAQKETGKLLQIGHQRRSNPRYIHCYDKVINESGILGRLTTVNGQWNRSKAACEDRGVVEKYAIADDVLKKYGFDSMKQFQNWRWYKGKGGGPIVDLGSHQIDIYSWFLGANPKSVMASGGVDYWTDHQWYDNVIAVFEYETKKGTVRASYQTLTTNSCGGYYEIFMGDEGSLEISEAAGRGSIYREADAPDWAKWVKLGVALEPLPQEVEKAKKTDATLDVRESPPPPPAYKLPVVFNDPYHQPHLKNFFDAVRGKAKLNCPAEVGYESAVAVLKVNEAVEAGKKLEYKEEEFKA